MYEEKGKGKEKDPSSVQLDTVDSGALARVEAKDRRDAIHGLRNKTITVGYLTREKATDATLQHLEVKRLGEAGACVSML